jgi:hypothetical protein
LSDHDSDNKNKNKKQAYMAGKVNLSNCALKDTGANKNVFVDFTWVIKCNPTSVPNETLNGIGGNVAVSHSDDGYNVNLINPHLLHKANIWARFDGFTGKWTFTWDGITHVVRSPTPDVSTYCQKS